MRKTGRVGQAKARYQYLGRMNILGKGISICEIPKKHGSRNACRTWSREKKAGQGDMEKSAARAQGPRDLGECFHLFFFFFFWPHCTACGILVPQPGIEPGSLAVKARSPTHWTAREVPEHFHLYPKPL